ncbi:MAG: hypothetical protein K0S37_4090 [Microbacterium sp.]|nr:hypothetical protein [Microbacterium sp.]
MNPINLYEDLGTGHRGRYAADFARHFPQLVLVEESDSNDDAELPEPSAPETATVPATRRGQKEI